jgi:hypothetical protein
VLRKLVEDAGGELAAQIATDVLIIEDETLIAVDLEALVGILVIRSSVWPARAPRARGNQLINQPFGFLGARHGAYQGALTLLGDDERVATGCARRWDHWRHPSTDRWGCYARVHAGRRADDAL